MIFKNTRAIWVVIFFLMSLMGLLMGAHTLHKVMLFMKLNTQTVGVVDAWEVDKLNFNKYQIVGKYHFYVDNSRYEGRKTITRKPYLNHFVIQEEIAKMGGMKKKIFYNRKNPSISSFEKRFPTKEVVNFSIIFIVGVYFLLFKVWIDSYKNN